MFKLSHCKPPAIGKYVTNFLTWKNICLKQARLETSLARYAHVGISPDVDCYDIESATQSLWLHQVLEEVLSTPKNHSIHLFCHHGSDRTGVVVATILFLCNVPRDTIVKEYAESPNAQVPQIKKTLTILEFDDFEISIRDSLRENSQVDCLRLIFM